MRRTIETREGDTMNANRELTAVLSTLAAGLVLVLAMVGHALLAAPDATATPGLTDQDVTYVQMLEQVGITPGAGHTDYDLALTGRNIVNDVRHGVSPLTIANQLYYGNEITWYQAKFIVVAALSVYAPDLLPPSAGTPELIPQPEVIA